MAEFLLEKLAFLTDTPLGQTVLTFLISMVPVVELRGAIPVAFAMKLSPVAAYFAAVLGNLLPVPFIVVFIRHVFAWIRRHLPRLNRMIDRLEEKGKNKKEKIMKSTFWGLFFFVAIPLPGTGAWTGALIAAMLDMRLKRAFPSILLGVLAAGLVVTAVSYGFVTLFSV